jgi:hypothetical protein
MGLSNTKLHSEDTSDTEEFENVNLHEEPWCIVDNTGNILDDIIVKSLNVYTLKKCKKTQTSPKPYKHITSKAYNKHPNHNFNKRKRGFKRQFAGTSNRQIKQRV